MKAGEGGEEPPRLLFIFGTRPEAIKLAPVIRYLRQHRPHFDVRVCVTAQHRGLLDQVLEAFEIKPEYDLDLMASGQTLFQTTAGIIAGLEGVLEQLKPDMVLVQGDTTTTFAGALAAFYARVPVAHVEAGLRTGDPAEPFPEEMNRVLTSRLSCLHLAPTERARRALLKEHVPSEHIAVTGNTGIDALLHVRDGIECGELRGEALPPFDVSKKLLLVTAHRRESFGEGMVNICGALAELALRPDAEIVFPVHPNPNVQAIVHKALDRRPNIHLVEPLSYIAFVDVMRRAHILITDSGGVQEEGPSLGKPILVLRNKTERPEAVEVGTVKLVGTDRARIVEEAERLLDDPDEYGRRTHAHNPYGDGRASERIADAIESYFHR